MRRELLGSAFAVCCIVVAATVQPAAAASITFTFDCDIAGSVCTPVSPIGTLQVSDSSVDANWVDIVLTLNSGDPQQFYLNYGGFPLPLGYAFEATGTSVDLDEDLAQADGYTLGFFDLVIPDTGNISGNPFATTLKLTNGVALANLDAMDFATRTTDDAFYSAVLKTQAQGWFGATTCDGCQTVPEPVPEPTSVTLLGLAGLGGGLAARRRRARTSQRP